ncbi:hypothetical protein QJS66_12805 [Kocuria rhizophila]|nr:hypothetical protein QJS66_12805 [Kocuria rhizophila]
MRPPGPCHPPGRRTPAGAHAARGVETGRCPVPRDGRDRGRHRGRGALRHALAVPFDERAVMRVSDVCVPADVVSESMTLDPLMRQAREGPAAGRGGGAGSGGTASIVTLEDLVGDRGRGQQRRPVQRFRRTRDGGLVVSGCCAGRAG